MVQPSADRLELNWPDPEPSRFIPTADLEWHVRVDGSGPGLLLLHGTGSSSHTWRNMMPMLRQHFTVVAPDLPGQGLSRDAPNSALSMPGMAAAVSRLMTKMGFSPEIVAGHSAGAAILIRMVETRAISPRTIISLNGALLPFGGFGGQLFAPLAKLLVLNPLVPRFLSRRAQDRRTVAKLLSETGSSLSDADIDCYVRLFRDNRHVAATLGMMARWDLSSLQPALSKLRTPLALVAAEGDRTVLPRDADRVAAKAPAAFVRKLSGLGHLAHEEKPDVINELILAMARERGVEALH